MLEEPELGEEPEGGQHHPRPAAEGNDHHQQPPHQPAAVPHPSPVTATPPTQFGFGNAGSAASDHAAASEPHVNRTRDDVTNNGRTTDSVPTTAVGTFPTPPPPAQLAESSDFRQLAGGSGNTIMAGNPFYGGGGGGGVRTRVGTTSSSSSGGSHSSSSAHRNVTNDCDSI